MNRKSLLFVMILRQILRFAYCRLERKVSWKFENVIVGSILCHLFNAHVPYKPSANIKVGMKFFVTEEMLKMEMFGIIRRDGKSILKDCKA